MKQVINKILCPYDGTVSSERTFKNILNLAKQYEATILILTCIKDKATFGFFKLKSDKKTIKMQKERALKKIENLKNRAQEKGVSIKARVIKCDVISKEIIDYARKEDADLIAMSKAKRGTMAEKMYNESTVEKVFREAPCTFMHIK